MKISGYKLIEEVARSSKSVVYRAVREKDEAEVAVKMPAETSGDSELFRRYKNEFQLMESLELPEVPRVFELHAQGGELYLVTEYLPGRSLDSLIHADSLGLKEKVAIALSLARVVGQLHATGIIHKDINPSNIFCKEEDGACTLLDFGLATRSRGQFPQPQVPELLEGTLAYMAPEQSGRMNREVDWRSDLYSLGVTLYHLFAGFVPFQKEDRLAIVYAHMAEQAQPLSRVEDTIPETLSRIVEKLMAKEPEERYQSAFGLASDLERCLEQLTQNGEITPFPLAQNDFSREFRIPGKLYGRSREIATMMEAFSRIERGERELFLVSGYSGIGKTSLIREIHKPVTRNRGNFISGKFDQYQREVPYAAFSTAFSQLVRQLLSESGRELERWRQVILAAVGVNGRVVTDVIPELEAVIGEQPEVPRLGPLESKNRFNMVFGSLIKGLADREHPLVLFLDDLQWIDTASLKLLEVLMTDEELGYFLLIGAYRDNEVDAAHPLMITLETMDKENVTRRDVKLAPLAQTEVEELVSDTLRSQSADTKALAELITAKTGGNPFFVNQFLKNLHEESLLLFDESRNGWTWEPEEIRRREITDNVVELLVGQMNRLEPQERNILRLAACIGGEFSARLIATISGEETAVAKRGLTAASDADFLLLLGRDRESGEAAYRFPHDRIQQAAYSLIETASQAETHLGIGRRLLEHWDRKLRPEEVFRIADQFNLGVSLLEDESERRRVARLDYEAGQRAKNAAAFASALEYFQAGEKLVSEGWWSEDAPFVFELYRELAECHYINGDFQEAEQLFSMLETRAPDDTARAQVYDLQLTLYINRGRLEEALDIGNRGLAMFGQEFPETPETLVEAKKAEFGRIKQNLQGVTDPMVLADRPPMQDRAMEAAMDLLMNLGIPAFIARKELFPVVGLRMVNLSLEHGNCKVSSYGYGFYGMILGAVLDDYAGGYAFGRLALALQDQFDNRALACKLYRIYGAYIDSWTRPYSEGIEHLRYAYHVGIETGDMVYAGYCLNHIFIRQFLIAVTLEEVEKETEKGLLFFHRNKDESVEALQQMMLQVVYALQGRTDAPTSLSGNGFDEKRELDAWHEKSYGTLLAYYYIYKLELAYLFGEYDRAREFAAKAEEYLGNMLGNVLKVEWVFYNALTELATAENEEGEARRKCLARVEELMGMMTTWAEYNPHNFRHKLRILQGEEARVAGRDWEAQECFSRGVQEAQECGILLDEALACELAASHLYAHRMEGPGEWFAHRAYRLYGFWGATTKNDDLKRRFPLLGTVASSPEQEGVQPAETVSESGSIRGSLDIESVLKNAQLLSSTLVYPKLVEHLLEMTMENSGAQKAALFSVEEGRLVIEAEKEPGHPPRIMDPAPLEEDADNYPASVLHYVHRSTQPVLLDDAERKSNGFSADRYISENHVRSLLVMPIVLRDKVRAILYLENRAVTGAFTMGRLQVINIFASQAAISLENAKLYGQLERRVEEEVKKRERQEQISIQQSKLAAMGEMIGNIAHQWRQPLTSLGVLVQDMKEAYAYGELDEAYLEENVGSVMKLVHKMSDTINDFQNFFKPDKIRERFLVADVIDDTLAIMGSSLLNHKIILEVDVEEGVALEGYRNEYGQVLLNLLSNAKDALLSRKKSDRRIWIRGEYTPEGRSRLIVRDNGGGIDASILEKIFDPYFTTKFKADGTGIGLYMSKMIIERNMDGHILAENSDDGAVFILEV